MMLSRATLAFVCTLGTLLGIAAPAVAADRVYVGKLRAGEDVDSAAAAALEQAVLVSAKKARPDLEVLGRGDVSLIAEIEAERQAAGCDTDSCAAEVADALGAPSVLTGQLSRVGQTWILTLSRLDRKTLTVQARDQVQAQGKTAEALVPEVPKLVAAVLGKAPGSEDAQDDDGPGPAAGVLASGAGLLGAGVVALAVGGVNLLYASTLYADAQEATDPAVVAAKSAVGEPVYLSGLVLIGSGAVLGVLGGALMGVAFLE